MQTPIYSNNSNNALIKRLPRPGECWEVRGKRRIMKAGHWTSVRENMRNISSHKEYSGAGNIR